IDTTGNFVIPPQYQIATKFYNSTAFVTDRENEKDYLINSNGDILYETAIWDLYIAYSRPGEPLIFGSSSGYGLADNGRIILEPKYDYIDNYKCGYALIGNDQKCGIVDLSGNIVVPIEFDSPDDAELEFKKLKPDFSGIYDEYDNAQIRFKITDDHILTDLSGKRIYDNEVYGVIEGGNGRWFISASGKNRTLVGITDEYGKFIVEPKYNYLVDPEQPAYRDNSWYHYSIDGYAFVFGDEDNYLIDRNGNIVFKMKDITP
ncbi:MAG: WG repeat-containing protein, partial [Firmicutes bacterium]|nr:WG repeat-containing protein [Bacillota bacterium]